MPPEPLSLDRKDFFKERKRERSESLGFVARWRGTSSHHGHREFNRLGSADFRRQPGHGKQGGWHMFSEDYGRGYTLPKYDKMQEGDTGRPSISRGEGKYGRFIRENRGSFSQRDLRGHSLENSNECLKTTGGPHEVNDQRAIDDTSAYPSPAHFDLTSTGDQLPSRDKLDKVGGVNGSGTTQTCDKENPLGSLEWKALKWARSGSFSSRGSGFSHSSSSKSMGAVDSNEAKVESLPKNVSSIEPPSGEAATFFTSAAASFEDTISKKKPRLKWGEGLAKFEKKKVDVPDEGLNRHVAVFSSCNSEPVHGSGLTDKSHRVNSFSDCASPATPSSVACSSSPGLEEKLYVNTINNDDASNLCMSQGPGTQSHLERFPFNLEKMDTNSIANLGSSLTELLQSEDPSPMDSSFVRSTAMSKLLVWKADVSKELEITETEIDMLENELKSLKSELGAHPTASSSLQVDSNAKVSHELGVLIPRPAPLQIISCRGDATIEEMTLSNGALEDAHADVKDEDIDSPGTATSKFVEPLALTSVIGPSVVGKNSESVNSLIRACTPTPGISCLRSGWLLTVGEPTCNDVSVLKITNDAPVSRDLSLHANAESVVCKLILASNKESADQANEVFSKLMPSSQYTSDKSEVSGDLMCRNQCLIREKFATRKRFIRFRERVVTLKFKALRHLWKEDLQVLSIKKHRAKSQRKFESSLRIAQSGCHKHRSSVRPRLSSPGNLNMVPTSEMINFTSKMRLDAKVRPYRNALKMPALILDRKEKVALRFVSSNGLVEDPCAIEKERAMINPWTPEEKEIFLNKIAIFGKDFRKIASFLEHKTTADCVEFYYKNHKSDSFEKTKKKLDDRKQGKPSTSTYMRTSGKKWNQEMNVASRDMLGAVSVMSAQTNSNVVNHHDRRFYLGDSRDSKISRGDDGILERTSSLDMGNERELAAADVLAGICGSMSSEAMSSCITSSAIHRPSIPDATQNLENETCSDESCGEMDSVDWTDEEKSIFIRAVWSYGKDFVKISRCVRTRSRDQCKVFFSKARKCLGLDLIRPRHVNVVTADNNESNGGGSDPEDACLVETGSGLKMEEDFPSSVIVSNNVEFDPSETVNKINNYVEAIVTSTPGECEMEDKHRPACDGDNVSESVQAPGSVVTLVNAEDGGTSSYLVVETSSCSGQSLNSGNAHLSSSLPSKTNLLQSERSVATANSSLQDSAVVQCEKTLSQDRLSSTHDPENKPVSRDDYRQNLSPILRGYPLKLPRKAANGDVSCVQLPGAQGLPKSEGNLLRQDCYLQKCSSSSSSHSVAELPLLPQNIEQTSDHQESHSRSLSDTEKPTRSGDVKLFGTILTTPCSQQSNCNLQENDNLSNKLSSHKFNVHNSVNGNPSSALMKLDRNNYLGLEGIPMRSYGFWDGNKIQTGFSSLPDSAMLLAKYPAAFGKMEQQPLQGIVRSSECNLNGVSVFPAREISNSNGIIDYPFTVDMKQRQDMLTEMQRRNGIVSSLQHQSRSMAGVNLVGGGGILVGGPMPCTGISDPVAAIKMHYAKADQYGVQTRSESWRGKRDVGL